ncbi:ABC transporter ATP-binding protein [Actinoplanes subtropicus]|uniref:ABC transporter ATP-binding protein n=1 Tax=Actinoplanes subtropicus TaxID=543632 RepID=UPI0006920D68|nr:ABC transporter ATP-binding protein [Actinoplanes subtropicus]
MSNHSAGGQIGTAWRTLKRFWPFAVPDRKLLMYGGALALLAAGSEVAAVYLFGVITDEALSARKLSAFWAPAALWLGAAAIGAFATFRADCMTSLAGERFLFRLRNSVFARVQRLPLDFLDSSRLGDLMTRLTDDVEAIEGLVASGLIRTVTALVSVVAFAAAAFVIRWDLALVACLLVPVFWLVSRSIGGKVQAAALDERQSNGSIASVVEESLSNQAVVQAYNRQQVEERRLAKEGRTWLEARMAEARLSSMYGPIVQVVETVCILVVLGMGAWELSSSRITLGGLLSFAAFLGYLYPPIQSLGQFSLTAAEAAAAVERLDDLAQIPPAVEDGGAQDNGWRARGRIDVLEVGFRYPRAERSTVDGLSFSADPGELVMLAGPSGAGKSTVTKLLLRFYDPAAGRILIDGRDIRQMPLATLRENVTLLHQESQLFGGSVYDNIAYGRPSASPDEVIRAARMAEAHEFIARLPEGYDTNIGHRGRLLSGGQRQRIAIARALLRDTPILVLDEPTTGLDRETSARIMEPLRRLMAGRTTIMIAHDTRLGLVPDQIVTLPGGSAEEPPPATPPRRTPTARIPALTTPPHTGPIPALVPSRFVGRATPRATGRAQLP